jgi:hypothetical protein
MWSWLRIVLRIVAVILIAGAAYLVVYQPGATVVGENLIAKANVNVKCSSAWDQWTHRAQPASLALNGTSLAQLPVAQSACNSASHKIKYFGAAMIVGAVGALVVSFVPRRAKRTMP